MKIKTSSVAIVILSWNDSKNTIECLKSVFKNDYLNYDVVLVDNNSTEGHFNNILSWCKSQRMNFHLINSKIKSFTTKNKNLFIFRINEVANFPFAKNLIFTFLNPQYFFLYQHFQTSLKRPHQMNKVFQIS